MEFPKAFPLQHQQKHPGNEYEMTPMPIYYDDKYNKIYKGQRFASSTWIEEWTVDACGQKLVVPIAFIPDKKGFGTSFSITPKYIYELSK